MAMHLLAPIPGTPTTILACLMEGKYDLALIFIERNSARISP
jgi:hypothetical protein